MPNKSLLKKNTVAGNVGVHHYYHSDYIYTLPEYNRKLTLHEYSMNFL